MEEYAQTNTEKEQKIKYAKILFTYKALDKYKYKGSVSVYNTICRAVWL